MQNLMYAALPASLVLMGYREYFKERRKAERKQIEAEAKKPRVPANWPRTR